MFKTDGFRIHYMSCVDLVRSFTLKSAISASLTNQNLERHGYTIPENPLQWRYYMHLAGEYHASDAMITVISSDTQEEIEFTKENLVYHPVTKINYSLGGRHYNELAEKYPSKVILIRGITRPIDKTVAIAANDMSILDYDRNLMASREQSLISEANTFINNFVTRWINDDFQLTNTHYSSSALSVLFAHLPNAIMNIRQKYARTHEVSDWHLWTYLGNHYDIDNYQNYLPDQQAIWLQRNIEYIRRQAGQSGVLEDLIDNLATPSSLEFEKIEFVLRSETLLATGRSSPDYTITDYYDENNNYATDSLIDTETAIEITKEDYRLNSREFDLDVKEALQEGKLQLHNKQPTGLLRVSEEFIGLSLRDMLELRVNYWFYLSSLDLYETPALLELPDGTSVSLTPRQLAILFTYATGKDLGYTLTDIPSVSVSDVIPVNPATFGELRGITPTDIISDDDITRLIANSLTLRKVSSIAELSEWTSLAAQQISDHRLQSFRYTTIPGYGHARNLKAGFLTTRNCNLVTSTTSYDEWFSSIKVDPVEFTEEDWGLIIERTMFAATGLSSTDVGLSPAKKAVLEIIEALTSYSLTIVESDGLSGVAHADWPWMNTDLAEITNRESPFIEVGVVVTSPVLNQPFVEDISVGIAVTESSVRAKDEVVEGIIEVVTVDINDDAVEYIETPFVEVDEFTFAVIENDTPETDTTES